jgi:RNA polymerase sigma factor (sigma-70 family)
VEVDRLYRKHSVEVLRYASLVLRSRSDAEDITQTVFLRALRAIERGEKVRAPRNWLIKITHNECRRLLATRKAHIELPDEIAVEPVETGRAEELRAAMAALPATQRQALVLRELEGRTYAEIAQALDLSESAIETLIFRARRALREQIENAMSCEEFAALLDEPSARTRVRAHARICPACATLDRQSRGRKSALKRIASAFGLPWWGAKLAAVALTTATVAAVTVVPHDGTRPSIPAPSHVTPAPRTTHQLNLIPPTAPAKHAAPRGGTRVKPFSPTTTPARRAVSTTTVRTTAVSPPTVASPSPEPPAPPTPEPAPAPLPVPPPTKVVPTPAPVATPVPAVNVPEVTVPPVTVPPVTVPTPTVSVPVPVAAPAPPTVTLPVQTPKVSLP